MALEAGDAREGTGLAGLMADKMREITKNEFDVKKGYHMLDAFAQAIIEHLKSEAEIAVETTGTASDVTPGVGTAPVTSTGTATIT